MASGTKGCAVVSQELRSAEKKNALLPGARVHVFQDLPIGISERGTLLARSQEAFFTAVPSLPAPRLAFTDDMGNVGAWVPGLLGLRVPQHRFRKTERFARDVILLQLIIDIERFELDE